MTVSDKNSFDIKLKNYYKKSKICEIVLSDFNSNLYCLQELLDRIQSSKNVDTQKYELDMSEVKGSLEEIINIGNNRYIKNKKDIQACCQHIFEEDWIEIGMDMKKIRYCKKCELEI